MAESDEVEVEGVLVVLEGVGDAKELLDEVVDGVDASASST